MRRTPKRPDALWSAGGGKRGVEPGSEPGLAGEWWASLTAAVDTHAVRAAASAWAATITARPLEAPSADREHLHEAASLRAVARLLSAGLLSTAQAV